jgi:hypothetical protein
MEWSNGIMAEQRKWRTEWSNGGNGRMVGMADEMVEWWEWSNGGRMAEWLNGGMARMVEWSNGGRMAEWHMAGMGEWHMKQSSTKGYEDELQAHFNSII